MVDVNPVNKNTSVNVSSSGTVSQIKTTTPQNYYDGLSKQWAISEDKVQGLDYSSKYYAQQAKENSQEALSALENVETATTNAINQITTTKNETLNGIYDISSQTQQEITGLKETLKSDLENTKVSAIDEVVQNKTDALDEIENTSAKEQEELNKIKEETKAFKDELVESGMFKFNLFDTKISDHILEGKEAKGWALQGTWVYKEAIAGERFGYPDFYQRCLDEKNAASAVSVTVAGQQMTVYKHPNGHKYYNISDKPIIDASYESTGIADDYGIDEENERVFLPRNRYFQQLTDDVSKVNEMMEAGLPNIKSNRFWAEVTASSNSIEGPFGFYKIDNGSSATTGAHSDGMDFDASRCSAVYGNSDTVQPPSSLKLLYYCVGNTEVTQAITNVTEVTTSENDTIPLFTGMYFDFKPNNVSWLKAGEQQNSAGVYKTCYQTLVEIVNGVNNYDLKVINQADMVSGVVYDEYWILDQDNLTFRTPLTIATKSLNGAVAGNGMTLGLTDGINNFGLGNFNNSNTNTPLSLYANTYGQNVGSTNGTQYSLTASSMGITTDPTKSGIIAKQSTAQLYFKVANAVQNLELLDAGEVLEGLANVIPDNSELIASYSKSSYKYIDLEYGASGTIYTAPANGYFAILIRLASSGGNTYLNLIDDQDEIILGVGMQQSTSATPTQSFILPVAKNQRMRLQHGANNSVEYFRFVYDQSSESEA